LRLAPPNIPYSRFYFGKFTSLYYMLQYHYYRTIIIATAFPPHRHRGIHAVHLALGDRTGSDFSERTKTRAFHLLEV
jgi:hypothetical protein